MGVIKYDNDIPASRDGTVAVPVGNRFDVGVPDPHTISIVSFRLAGCFTTPYLQQRITVFDVDNTAMKLVQLTRFSAGGSCVSTAGSIVRSVMVPDPIVHHSGPFVAAILNTPFAGCEGNTAVGGTREGVALSAGTVDPGHGFHAIRVLDSMSTVANLGPRNAILRAGGGNLPVELMDLSVE